MVLVQQDSRMDHMEGEVEPYIWSIKTNKLSQTKNKHKQLDKYPNTHEKKRSGIEDTISHLISHLHMMPITPFTFSCRMRQ